MLVNLFQKKEGVQVFLSELSREAPTSQPRVYGFPKDFVARLAKDIYLLESPKEILVA